MMSVGLHCRLVGRPGRAAALARFLDYVRSHEKVWVTRRRHRAPLAEDASGVRPSLRGAKRRGNPEPGGVLHGSKRATSWVSSLRSQ